VLKRGFLLFPRPGLAEIGHGELCEGALEEGEVAAEAGVGHPSQRHDRHPKPPVGGKGGGFLLGMVQDVHGDGVGVVGGFRACVLCVEE